jgi:hypothetical protein
MRHENQADFLQWLKRTAKVLLYHCHERRRRVQCGMVRRHAKLQLSFYVFRLAVSYINSQ